ASFGAGGPELAGRHFTFFSARCNTARENNRKLAENRPAFKKLTHVKAAVDVQRLAGDISGLIARQEGHGGGNLLRRAETPDRDLPDQGIALLFGQLTSH